MDDMTDAEIVAYHRDCVQAIAATEARDRAYRAEIIRQVRSGEFTLPTDTCEHRTFWQYATDRVQCVACGATFPTSDAQVAR